MGSRAGSSKTSPVPLLGAKTGRTPRPSPGGLAMVGRRHAARRDDPQYAPGHPRHPRLVHEHARSTHAAAHGLTRDGNFLIENGRIAGPVRNFRFNESLIAMLGNLDAIGPAARIHGGDLSGGPVAAPPLLVKSFNFASRSQRIWPGCLLAGHGYVRARHSDRAVAASIAAPGAATPAEISEVLWSCREHECQMGICLRDMAVGIRLAARLPCAVWRCDHAFWRPHRQVGPFSRPRPNRRSVSCFPSADGKTSLVGYVFEPPATRQGPHPAVVLMQAAPAFDQCARSLRCGDAIGPSQGMGDGWAAHGYVALLVDGFGPRGYPQGFPRHSYDERPAELDEVAIRPLDAYGALRLFAVAPRRRACKDRIDGLVERRQRRAYRPDVGCARD